MIEMACLAAGGFLGAVARFAAGSFISSRWPSRLPLGTMLVNVIGSFLLGWIAGAGSDGYKILFLGTGFMGAFTTFSTFKWESLRLMASGQRKIGLLYMGLTYLLGVGAAWCGLFLGT